MKTIRNILAVCIGILFLILLILQLAAPDPSEVAWSKCNEKGWQRQDLGLLEYRISGILFRKTGHFSFQVKDSNPPKILRIELRKPVFSMNWKVVRYEEEEQHSN